MKAWNSNMNCTFGFLFSAACECVCAWFSNRLIYLFIYSRNSVYFFFVFWSSYPSRVCDAVSFAPIINVCGMRILLKKLITVNRKQIRTVCVCVYSSRVCYANTNGCASACLCMLTLAYVNTGYKNDIIQPIFL